MRKLPRLGGLGRAVFAVLAFAGGLATYYYLSSSAKEAELEQRNLRLLGLMSRQVASSVNGLEGIFQNTSMPLGERGANSPRGTAATVTSDIEAAGRLVSHLDVEARVVGASELTGDGAPPECGGDGGRRIRFDATRLILRQDCSIRELGILVTGVTDLRAFIQPMLRSEVFDEVLLIDGSGRILLQNGGGLLMARQLDLPPAKLDEAGEVEVDDTLLASFSRSAEIRAGGKSFKFFLQPVVGLVHESEAGELALVGLTGLSRFRADAGTIDPNKLLLLLLLLVFVVLCMPFLKFTAMAPTDPVGVRDVLFFFFSLVMGAGVLTFVLIDVHWYLELRQQLDRQGALLATQIEAHLYQEIEEVVAELKAQNERLLPPADDAPPQIRTGVPRESFTSYPYLEMVAWADATGMQRAKWTSLSAATPIVSMSARESFQRVRDGRLWALPPGQAGEAAARFSIESIRSRNTGQELVTIAIPYDRQPGWATFGITRALSVIDTVLPPGHGFMIVEPDGDVLFHSLPERNLRENLFEASEGDALLRSAISGRVERAVSFSYRGTGVRAFVRPLEIGDLTVVSFVDKGLLRTINFETVAFTSFLFAIYLGLVLLVFSIYAIFASQAQVRWIWPDRDRPVKYVATAGVQVATMVLFMILHPLAPRVLMPVTFALPFVALGFSILILIQGLDRIRRLKLLALALIAISSLFNLLAIINLRSPWTLIFFALHLLACRSLLRLADRPPARLLKWSTTHMRTLYVGAGLATLVVAGMLTAATFFRIVHFDHARLLLRYGQLEMARAMDARYASCKSAYGDSERLLTARLCQSQDLYFEPFFGTTQLSSYPDTEAPCGTLDPQRLEADRAVRGGFDRSADVHRLLAEYLPFYDQLSVNTRLLFEHQASDARWSWWRVPRAERTELEGEHPFYLDFAARDSSARGGASFTLLSNSPALTWSRSIVWWLAVLASVVGVMAALRFVVRRMFLLDLEVPGPIEVDRLFRDGVSSHLLLLCPPLSNQVDLFRRPGSDPPDIVNVRHHLGDESYPSVEPADEAVPVPLYVVHSGAALSDPVTNLELLQWLEKAVDCPGRVVVMACSRRAEAEHFMPEAASPEGAESGRDATDPLFRRWNELLAQFTRVHTKVEPDQAAFDGRLDADVERLAERLGSGVDAELEAERLRLLADLIRRESLGNQRLQEIGLKIIRLPGLERRTPSEVLESIRVAADGYYRALWVTLTPSEKLVAAHLARGYLPNYKASGSFRQLAQKLIVVRQPHPHLMNESFARFVRDEAEPEKLIEWEGEPGPSIWRQLRTPIYIAVLATAVFLFLTQRALFQSTLAVASAMTAALPLLFRLLDQMQHGPDRGQER